MPPKPKTIKSWFLSQISQPWPQTDTSNSSSSLHYFLLIQRSNCFRLEPSLARPWSYAEPRWVDQDATERRKRKERERESEEGWEWAEEERSSCSREGMCIYSHSTDIYSTVHRSIINRLSSSSASYHRTPSLNHHEDTHPYPLTGTQSSRRLECWSKGFVSTRWKRRKA